MTMQTTPNSSASRFEEMMPVLFGEPGTASEIGSDMNQHSTPRSIFDARLLQRSLSNGTVAYATTSVSGTTKFPELDQSSGVFASKGLERNKFQAYFARVDALRHTAAQDGYHLNPGSESDFWRFVASEPRWRKANLVLMDNSNLRAVWKDGQGTRMGLQFLGGGMVQHVIFSQRAVDRPISRVAGRDTLEGIWRQVEAFDLRSLLYE